MSPLTIAEQLAHCTVRLECDVPGGVSTGTGFFFNFAEEDGKAVPAIVTNRHVVKDATVGRFQLTVRALDGGPLIGSTVSVVLDKFESLWTPHSSPTVDLCAMPIAPLLQQAEAKGKAVFYRHFAMSQVASDADLKDLDQIEEITMVGYPTGLWDKKNNMPVFRRGATATHPAHDWNGKPEFMIDAACFPGSSGSPVLLFNNGGLYGQARKRVSGRLPSQGTGRSLCRSSACRRWADRHGTDPHRK